MNWILLGVTTALTVFILVIRIGEVIKYRKNVKVFKEKNKEYEVLYNNYISIYMFLALAVVVFVVSMFVEAEFLERVSMSVIFAVLCLSEATAAWMNSRLYVSDKEFLYGQAYDRFRSIKTYKAKGKRTTIVVSLKGEEYVMPNTVSELIQAKVKQIKQSKK